MSAVVGSVTKHCPGCDLDLDLGAFARHHKRGDGLQNRCRACCAKQQADSRRRAPRRKPVLRRPRQLKDVYAGSSSRLLLSAHARLTKLELGMVRCTLPTVLPTDQRQVALATRWPCSSLVFGGRELEHCQEVHGLADVPAGAFEARVEERVAA